MKKAYVRPSMVCEVFAADEYVAACGDMNKVYKFKCDAGKWAGLTGYQVYTNGLDGIKHTSDDVDLGAYQKCDITHEASAQDEFISGYMRKNIVGIPSSEYEYDVIIWRGEDGRNVHCTTNLNIDSWETAKS